MNIKLFKNTLFIFLGGINNFYSLAMDKQSIDHVVSKSHPICQEYARNACIPEDEFLYWLTDVNSRRDGTQLILILKNEAKVLAHYGEQAFSNYEKLASNHPTVVDNFISIDNLITQYNQMVVLDTSAFMSWVRIIKSHPHSDLLISILKRKIPNLTHTCENSFTNSRMFLEL